MDSKRDKPAPVKMSPFDVLRKGNYHIDYNFDSEREIAEIVLSWKEEGFYFKYEDGKLVSNWLPKPIECLPLSVPALVNICLRKICESQRYPSKFVFYKLNGKITNIFYFDLDTLPDEEIGKVSELLEMSTIVFNYGLKREYIEEARQKGFLDNYLEVLAFVFSLNIEMPEDDDIVS